MASNFHSAASAEDARQSAEAGDSPSDLVRDELAESIREQTGCSPSEAQDAAASAFEKFSAFFREHGARMADILGLPQTQPDGAAPSERERLESMHVCALREIVEADTNAALLAHSMLLARDSGLDDHDSLRQAARRHGVSVEAMRKRRDNVERDYNLPRGRHHKSEGARKTYKLTNRPNFSNAKAGRTEAAA